MKFRPLADEIRELEQSRISAALAAAAGNQRLAAQMLAMPLRTFVFKLKQYGLRRIDNDDERRRERVDPAEPAQRHASGDRDR